MELLKLSLFLVLCALAEGAKLRGPVPIQAGTFLQVQGNKFVYGDDEVYLSGTNTGWINYGNDFGNNQWDQTTGAQWVQNMKELGDAGANSIRVWVHVEGAEQPEFDSNGFCTGTDAANTLIPDLRKLLDACQENGIFMNLVLWNGAEMREQNYKDLFFDDAKLQAYIDNALIPMVNALKDHPALGAWEPMNEPEGSSPAGQTDSNPCYDFTHLDYAKKAFPGMKAPGWSGGNVPMRNILRFHNWIIDAIHTADPKAIVSAGSWSHFATSDATIIMEDPIHKYGFNHYKDSCLMDAGGRPRGTVDFWQFHSYPWAGAWIHGQPWTGLSVADYELDGPIVLGEFPTATFALNYQGAALPNGDTTEDLVEYAYTHDFNGGWTWYLGTTLQADQDVFAGTRQLEGRTDHGVVDVVIE